MEAIKDKKIEKQEINNDTNSKSKISTIYNLICIFFIASIIGWIYEMIFYKITENTLENRGFLYGPYVPVYGFGAVLIVILLKRFKKNPIILFVGTMLITGILEYIVGEFMFSVWHKRWWDYTGLFFNINGHVCLRSVLSFSVGGLALIYLIEPWVLKMNDKMKAKVKSIVYITIIAVMLLDLSCCLIVRHPVKI